ncbi:26S proteasome regulatory subunit-like protein [Stachybotrys elegans]|uniref:26S proteasome regulatory subunit-like protein n=1 Tax=Stachybotrys elegans TaxID=80388 RepID=A0A8K0SJF9_9HYPO|nr:26S proteasome regulatory subunit-like protein [Stachybotrys elegans]
MQSDNWNGLAHFTPRMNRFSHHRESSLSSLGSTGPASPFAPSTSNPQIAVTADSTNDMLSDAQTHDSAGTHGNSYYQLSAKAMGHYAPAYQNMDSTIPDLAYPLTIPGPNSKPRSDRGLLPAPEFGNGQNRSHPASVASSVAGDSPATPTIGDSDMADKRRRGYTGVPKLARTMTDVYGDELYNPNFTITSTSQTHPSITTSPTNDVFNQRIHAANNQHLSAAHSPVSSVSRDRSPFRTGSPLAPSPRHDFGSSNPSIQFNSAQRMREQTKAEQDARLFQQHMVRDVEPETPKTISPKDAILEFHESDAGDANFPLFPQESAQFDMDQLTKAMISQNSGASCAQPTSNAHNNGQLGFMPANVPQSLQIPQQYPFVARTGLNQNTPPRLSSAGSSTPGSGGSTPVAPMRPAGIAADGGTYTCTYHGCTQRFETPALLQKHKREGHRQQGTTIGAPRPHDSGMTSSLVNSQAGPHRCDRINPGTGKPCNTIFSRPYDLTRHEDTIHNARKQKVRCDLCTEEKTFSRADALTRHYRVCHPDMALPGKHRRRGGI